MEGELATILSPSPAFSTRLFAVLRFESVIHEFDPYFNFRTTKFLAQEGFYSFHNWFDDRAWYPLGRIIGGTIYPGEWCGHPDYQLLYPSVSPPPFLSPAPPPRTERGGVWEECRCRGGADK